MQVLARLQDYFALEQVEAAIALLLALASLALLVWSLRRFAAPTPWWRSLPVICGVMIAVAIAIYALSGHTSLHLLSLLSLTLLLLSSFIVSWFLSTRRNTTATVKNQVFASMTQGIIILDDKLRMVELNHIVETLIKQSSKDLQGREIYELNDSWPQLVQFCRNLPTQYDDAASDSQELANEVIDGEVAYSGDWQQFFEARSSRLVNQHHLPAGWAIVLTDISEQKRNTRILADEKNRLHLLYTLSQQLYSLLTPDEAASKAVDLTVAALGLYMGELALLESDNETLRVVAVSMQSKEKVEEINHAFKLRVGSGLAGTAAAERTLTIWTQLGRDQKWYERVGIEVSVRSGAAIPLLVGERLLGVLTLLSDEQDGISESDRPLFTAIALPIALSLQNAYRFAEAQRRSQFFEEISNLSDALRHVDNQKDVINTFLSHCLSYFGAEEADIALPSEDGNLLCSTLYPDISIPIRGSMLGHIFSSGQCYYSPNMLVDPLRFKGDDATLDEPIDSPGIAAIHAPLRVEGTVIGVLILQSSDLAAFQPDDLQMLATFAEIGGSAMWRAQILATLEQRVRDRTGELAGANQQLSELDQLKNEFIASVNHELRTPLTNIKLYLSLLAEGKEERRPKYMEVLQRETGHLTRLLDGSLDLTKLEKARITGSRQHLIFDVRNVISSMIDKYAARIQAKGLEFRVDAPDSAVVVEANQEQIDQAVSNLLENAIDYTDHGFVGIEILADEESVRVCISDSGYGIPQNEMSSIWNRFFRGKRVRGMTQSGYGLGLSIVKEIVDLHKGQISVKSKENSGSRFELLLPAVTTKLTNGMVTKGLENAVKAIRQSN